MSHGNALRVGRVLWAIFALAAHSAFDIESSPAALPSAQEILDKSQAVMAPPIQYRLSCDKIEMTVYQKKQTDGSLALRTEMSTPFARTTLLVGNDSYEFFPDYGVAIDTRFMIDAVKSQAASMSSAPGAKAASSAKLRGTVIREGKECFDIETTFSPELTALVRETLPAANQKMLPKGQRFVIEKTSYTLVEFETFSQAGVPASKSEFKDVKRNPDLPADLFMLPDGLEIQKPGSIQEYTALLANMFKPTIRHSPLPPDIAQRLAPAPAKDLWGPVEIDPRTGRPLPRLPPGVSRAELDRHVAEAAKTLRAERSAQPPAGTMSTARIVGISVSLFTTIGLAGFMIWRRRSRVAD